MALLHEQNREDAVYVYRIGIDEKTVKPHLLKCGPWPELIEHLQAHYGGGSYRIMIRRRRTMILTITFAIAPMLRGNAAK